MHLTVRSVLPAALLLAMPAMAVVHHPQRTSKTTHATIRHASTHTSTSSHHRHAAVKAVSHHFVSPAMTTDRATAIQSALIKSGYMTGEPTGQWDPASIAAMQKMQSDNGWQTKIMPDSRALIKLGLGPQGPTQ